MTGRTQQQFIKNKRPVKLIFKLLALLAVGLSLFSFLTSPSENKTTRPVMCVSTTQASEVLRNLDTTKTMAPLIKGLGDYAMPVTTSSQEARNYFNQGLTLYYGFNRKEAFRSFSEASRLDPNFAMAYWGQAMSLGPNINEAMDPADCKMVYTAVLKAVQFGSKTTSVEQELIRCVAQRYVEEPPIDRSHLDKAYAEAMRKAAEKFSTDADVVTLYAESLMDLHPWDYFLKDGTPQPWTAEILSTIEKAMALNPRHVGCNHLYIHAYEASNTPGKATASADLLRDLVPGAGHLVHMPSHIYIRTGRYEDGVIANQKAVKIDEEYIAQCKAEGFYPLVLFPHNMHFLWACATLDGQGAQAIKAADRLAAKQNFDLMIDPVWTSLQHFYATPYYARVRFGKWDDILRLEQPDSRLKYANAIWRYARAIAFARKGKTEQASNEITELSKIVNDESIATEKILGINSMPQVLKIALYVAKGELAFSMKNYPEAISSLKNALKLEDELLYQEPYDWHHPVRQVLGDVLLASGDAVQAEKYFREDLWLFANNGWSLTGLKLALEKQGKIKDAKEVGKQLKTRFARADVKLVGARL
jgi:tetratricopeptide (TPR) repeat protein